MFTRRVETMCVLVSVLAASCSLDPFEPTIAGDRDAAVRRDAGGGHGDAGATDGGGVDAGPRVDAGPGDDGGMDSDAGGELVDAGFDAGVDAGPTDACVVGTETCNGGDDDCDGTIDEDSDVACMNACGDTGFQRCVGATLEACDARSTAIERCNGMDDDCDGMVDETGGCRCDVVQYMGHGYQICGNRRRWQDAVTECAGDGYALVTIEDMAENDFVRTEAMMRRPGEDWWIGYNDEATEGTFEWVSGSTSTFTNWATGQPDNSGFNSDCAELLGGTITPGSAGEWNDTTCNNSQPYVCESP